MTPGGSQTAQEMVIVPHEGMPWSVPKASGTNAKRQWTWTKQASSLAVAVGVVKDSAQWHQAWGLSPHPRASWQHELITGSKRRTTRPSAGRKTESSQSLSHSVSANLTAERLSRVKGCCWTAKRCQDSWPPEEKNSIQGQRRVLITQSFGAIKFSKR